MLTLIDKIKAYIGLLLPFLEVYTLPHSLLWDSQVKEYMSLPYQEAWHCDLLSNEICMTVIRASSQQKYLCLSCSSPCLGILPFSMGPRMKGHGVELQLACIHGSGTRTRSKSLLFMSEFSLPRLRLSLLSPPETTQCSLQNESRYFFKSLQSLPWFSLLCSSILILKLLPTSSSLAKFMVHSLHSQIKHHLS